MKLREKILYMSFGAGLVILGISFNLLFPFLISTGENGGSLDYFNQTGENTISLTVGLDGSGLVERILKDSSDSKGSVNKNSGSFKGMVK